jgi:hypothetical protein
MKKLKLKMSKPKLKVYRPGGFYWHKGFDVIGVSRIEDAELVTFPGGSDVNPLLYGHKNSKCYISEHSKQDDIIKLKEMEFCVKNNIPMVGICRGGQLLTVMAGGTLIQDVSHPSWHSLTTFEGNIIQTVSIHHNMFNPYCPQIGKTVEFETLAWAENLSHKHTWQDGKDYVFPEGVRKEVEIVYYPEIRGFAIQGHPEMNGFDKAGFEFAERMIMQKLFGIVQNKNLQDTLLLNQPIF